MKKKSYKKRIFDAKISELEGMIHEKDAKLHDLVQHVDELEAKHSALGTNHSDTTIILEERLDAIEKERRQKPLLMIFKFKTLERKIYIFEKRRLMRIL